MPAARTRSRSLAVLVAATVASAPTASHGAPQADNPFERVVRHEIDGLVVHVARVPGGWTHASVTIGAGSADDPPGRPGTAHLLEHACFADDDESQLAQSREVALRGGSSNGTTHGERTTFWIRVPTDQTRFAVDWLGRRVADRRFTDAQVTSERHVVAMEGGIVPVSSWVELGSRLGSAFDASLAPAPAAECPSRLGLGHDHGAQPTWTSLGRITRADLQAFFERHYVRERAVVAVFGDVEPGLAATWVAESFAGMRHGSPRHVPPPDLDASATECSQWTDRSATTIRLAWFLEGLDGADRDVLYVVRDAFEALVNDRLRYEETAAYWLDVGATARGPVADLVVSGRVDPARSGRIVADVRAVMDDLRHGRADLDAVRSAVAHSFAVKATTPAQLADWVEGDAWDRAVYDRFPDPVSRACTVTPEQVGAWLSEHLRDPQPGWVVSRPDPVPAGLRSLASSLPVALVAIVLLRRAARRARSVRGTSSLPLRWGPVTGGVTIGIVAAGAWVASLVARACARIALDVGPGSVSRLPSLALEIVEASALPVALVVGACLVPWRVLADDEALSLDALGWRVGRLPWASVTDLRAATLDAVLTSALPWRVRMLSLSPLRTGTWVIASGRRSWFLRVDDPGLLAERWAAARGRLAEARAAEAGASGPVVEAS